MEPWCQAVKLSSYQARVHRVDLLLMMGSVISVNSPLLGHHRNSAGVLLRAGWTSSPVSPRLGDMHVARLLRHT